MHSGKRMCVENFRKLQSFCNILVLWTHIETGKIYWGAREMERQLGIKHNNIAKAIRNGTQAGGYHWQYVDLEGGEYDS